MALLFPDTTVLISFALAGRLDLFAEIVGKNGAWTLTIAQEWQRYPRSEVPINLLEVLGDPIWPAPAERAYALQLRERIARPGDRKESHQGEAETVAVMKSRGIVGGFVSDAIAAADLARSPDIGIPVYTTADLMRLAVRTNRLDLASAWQMIEVLRTHDRARGMPAFEQHVSQWVFG